MEFYDNRTSAEIFEELESLDDSEKTDAICDVLQNWIDWNYKKEKMN